METYHIHINGIVQGVGFRPMVYKIANEMALKGYVNNSSNGVNIVFNATDLQAVTFFEKIRASVPKQAKIISSYLQKTEKEDLTDFRIIVKDDQSAEKQVLMSPDVALCSNCKSELTDINNRRYRYPFITCTQCGPRYSIINNLPYERHHTAMHSFSMCESCDDEYSDVNDRRFFSQTNSCEGCGIKLSLHKDASSVLTNETEEILSAIKNHLQQGEVLAVKGIGGYLLLCDADNAGAIQLLRDRKHRLAKPFAVLYPDMDSVERNFAVNEKEKLLLESAEAPIVLLYPKKESKNIHINNIAPGLKRVGVMLPYSPLLALIANDFGRPLIATSANISGSAIIYKDEDAMDYLFEIADYVISYNREITIPQDDSVIQVSKYGDQQIILRRSRGYAPSFLSYRPKSKELYCLPGLF